MAPQKCKKACTIEAQARINVKTVQACTDCMQRCLPIHIQGKGKPNTTIPSFFKVMIGDRFSELLLIPPKFARTMMAAVGQKIELGDSSGRLWALELASIDGYLAFQQGWSDFSIDHGLELGDFVVFFYISAFHFNARIYKRSGCEQLNFIAEDISKKERKPSSCNVVSGSHYTAAKKSSIDNQDFKTSAVMGSDVEEKQKSPTSNSYSRRKTKEVSQSKAEHVEDPYLLVDRVTDYTGEDRKNLLYSYTGNRYHNADSDIREDKNSLGSKTFQVGDIYCPSDSILKNSVVRELNPCASLRDVLTKRRSRDTSDENTDLLIDAFKMDSVGESKPSGKWINTMKKETVEESTNFKKGKWINTMKKETVEESTNFKKEKKQIKKEQYPETNGREIVVNTKSDMLVENKYGSYMVAGLDNISTTNITQLPYLDEVFFSCVVHEQHFQELPLFSKSLIKRARKKMDRAVVYLRDLENRVWPVMCSELRMRRVLSSGWYDFKVSNHVEIGDECMFFTDSSSTARDMYNIFVKPKSTNTITYLPSQTLLQ